MDSQKNTKIPENDAFKKVQQDDQSDEKLLTDAEVWAFVAKMQHWHIET